jgi:hypothetical protein
MSNSDHAIEGRDSNRGSGGVTIRPATERDLPALNRLVQLDSAQLPPAPLFVAEIDGQPVAGVSLATGESFADPFSRTAEVRAVLELRAAQLRHRETARRRRRRRIRRPASRAALAGGPPGMGPWLISLGTRRP